MDKSSSIAGKILTKNSGNERHELNIWTAGSNNRVAANDGESCSSTAMHDGKGWKSGGTDWEVVNIKHLQVVCRRTSNGISLEPQEIWRE